MCNIATLIKEKMAATLLKRNLKRISTYAKAHQVSSTFIHKLRDRGQVHIEEIDGVLFVDTVKSKYGKTRK